MRARSCTKNEFFCRLLEGLMTGFFYLDPPFLCFPEYFMILCLPFQVTFFFFLGGGGSLGILREWMAIFEMDKKRYNIKIRLYVVTIGCWTIVVKCPNFFL